MSHLSLTHLSPSADVRLPVHISRPSASARGGAAVIVCHHGIGIYQDAFLRDYADNLAKCGFLVALPDFFHRAWPKTKINDSRGAGLTQKEMPSATLIQSVSDEDLISDLTAVVKMLEEEEGVASIGVTGFCLGGRTAWLAACALPDKIQACNMCHGGNITVSLRGSCSGLLKMVLGQYVGVWAQRWVPGASWSASPYDRRASLKCPVAGHVGELDTNPSPEIAEMLRQGLVECGNEDVEFFVYPGAKHGFCVGDSDSHQPEGAALAWKRTASFLLRTLLPGATPEIPPAIGQSTQTGSACTDACAQIAQKAEAAKT